MWLITTKMHSAKFYGNVIIMFWSCKANALTILEINLWSLGGTDTRQQLGLPYEYCRIYSDISVWQCAVIINGNSPNWCTGTNDVLYFPYPLLSINELEMSCILWTAVINMYCILLLKSEKYTCFTETMTMWSMLVALNFEAWQDHLISIFEMMISYLHEGSWLGYYCASLSSPVVVLGHRQMKYQPNMLIFYSEVYLTVDKPN